MRMFAVVAALSGCGIDFESPSEVLDLRTLAIVAEPPEVLVADPLPPVSLRALIVDPRDPTRSVTAHWRACPPTDDRRCEQAAEQDREDLGSSTGPLPEFEASLTFTESLLLAARREDPLQGFGGAIVYAEVTVNEGEPDEEVAFKEIVLQLDLPEGTTPNANPQAPTLLRDEAPWAEDEIPTVAPGQELVIEPVSPEGDAEAYSVFRFDLQIQDLEEHLAYHFFSSAGSWNRGETGGPPDPIATETTLASRWTAPLERTRDGDPVSVWIVVRDGRGGVAWTERRIEVRQP
jgi:hypothetical protein